MFSHTDKPILISVDRIKTGMQRNGLVVDITEVFENYSGSRLYVRHSNLGTLTEKLGQNVSQEQFNL